MGVDAPELILPYQNDRKGFGATGMTDFSYQLQFKIDLSIVSLFIGVLSSLAFIIVAWLRAKRTPLLKCFLNIQILFFTQYAANLLIFYFEGWGNNWFFTAIDYLFYCFISPAFLVFVYIFTNNQTKVTPRKVFLLFSPEVLIYFLLLTDPLHHLFFITAELSRRVYGPFFWLHYLVVIVYLSAGIYHLLKYSVENYHYIKRQTHIFIAATFITIITTVIYIFRIGKYSFFIASCGLEITMVLFVWATYYRFFNITPLALRRIAENIEESIIVVDNHNEINNFNSHFAANFLPVIAVRKSDDIQVFLRELRTIIIADEKSDFILKEIRNPKREYITGELTVLQPEKKTYMVNIQPVFSKQDLIGRVISFNDISDYKNLLEEYNKKNIELNSLNQELIMMNHEVLTVNERLQEYASTVEELTVVKERNRLARDVHDTLGHTMTLVLTSLEVGQIYCEKDLEVTKKYLAEATRITREGITELRNSIRGLIPERINATNLSHALERLIADFRISGMKVDFSFTGSEDFLRSVHADAVYRICQEALTNSFRHGIVREISIFLEIGRELIEISIFDNGYNGKDFRPGYGLTGMKQRVEDLKGRITFGPDGEQRFVIHAEIPLNAPA